jgi:hypothetical protein
MAQALVGVSLVQSLLKYSLYVNFMCRPMNTNFLLYTKNEQYRAIGKKPQESIQRYLSE